MHPLEELQSRTRHCFAKPMPQAHLLCMLQVLELVISAVTDTKTLAACSVSQHFQQYITRTVQLQLVHILQHCEELRPDSDLRPLQWLCSVAGAAAVNTTEAGCALLNLSRGAHVKLSAVMQTTGTTSLSKSCPMSLVLAPKGASGL